MSKSSHLLYEVMSLVKLGKVIAVSGDSLDKLHLEVLFTEIERRIEQLNNADFNTGSNTDKVINMK